MRYIRYIRDEVDMKKYENYFQITKRLTSEKQIAIVKGELLADFLKTVIEDSELSSQLKAFICVAASGGLRVSEALDLKKTDFINEDGMIFVKTKVLKKRKEESRLIRIHPAAQEFISDYVKEKVGCIFKLNASTFYRQLLEVFPVGICNHSFRHSNISFLLFQKEMTHIQVAKLLHIGLKTIEHYAHLDERKLLKSIY